MNKYINSKPVMYILFIAVIIVAIFRYINLNEKINVDYNSLTKETYTLETIEAQEDYIYLYFNDEVIGIIDKSSYFDYEVLTNYLNKELSVVSVDTNEVDINFEIVSITYGNNDIFTFEMYLKEVKRNQNINLFFIILFPVLLLISLFINSKYFKDIIKKKKITKINMEDPDIRSNYDKIRGAIIYKNREYHLSDKLEVNEDMIALLLPKVLFDLLKENELRVIKDNEEGYIVAFKINDELFFEYTLLDDNNHDTIYITMSYPSERDILDEELEAFKNSLNEYNSLFNKDIRIG